MRFRRPLSRAMVAGERAASVGRRWLAVGPPGQPGPVRGAAMLLDQVLPEAQVTTRREALVRATPGRVFAAVTAADLTSSFLIQALMPFSTTHARWRPAARREDPFRLTITRLYGCGFVPLGACPPSELAIGVVGKLWFPQPRIRAIDPAAFASFDAPGCARAAIAFTTEPLDDRWTRLALEGRMAGLDGPSRRRVRCFWLAAGWMIGLVLREAAEVIRVQAEGPTADGRPGTVIDAGSSTPPHR